MSNSKKQPQAPLHSMKYVSQITGLTSHVIRIWENRYKAIVPQRASNNRRLYSTEDIQKLKKLQTITGQGMAISQVAHLSLNELDTLIHSFENKKVIPTRKDQNDEVTRFVMQAQEAIEDLNTEKLHDVLNEASITLNISELLFKLIIPVCQNVGRSWEEGDINVANEHLATATLRTFLGSIHSKYKHKPGAPIMIATTPQGHLHELASLCTAILASFHKWNSLFLGANLPLNQVLDMALKTNAKLIAISTSYNGSSETLYQELKDFISKAPNHLTIYIGGSAAKGFTDLYKKTNVKFSDDLVEFEEHLKTTR